MLLATLLATQFHVLHIIFILETGGHDIFLHNGAKENVVQQL